MTRGHKPLPKRDTGFSQFAVCLFLTMSVGTSKAETTFSPSIQHEVDGTSVVITGTHGKRLRLTSYGHHMVRVQAVRPGEEFFPDDRYEMIVAHPSD